MSDFLATLKCPNCGGKLSLIAETQRYRCDYCGNEHIARHDGRVDYRPDKTTSEDAIRRLTAEIEEAEAAIQTALRTWEEGKGQIELNTQALHRIEGNLAKMRQEIIGAKSFRLTRWFTVIYVIASLNPFMFVLSLLFANGPTLGAWVGAVITIALFGVPIGLVAQVDRGRVRHWTQKLRAAEAAADRDRALAQARIDAARAATGPYPTEQVAALRAEIAEKKQQLAVHYEVVNGSKNEK